MLVVTVVEVVRPRRCSHTRAAGPHRDWRMIGTAVEIPCPSRDDSASLRSFTSGLWVKFRMECIVGRLTGRVNHSQQVPIQSNSGALFSAFIAPISKNEVLLYNVPHHSFSSMFTSRLVTLRSHIITSKLMQHGRAISRLQSTYNHLNQRSLCTSSSSPSPSFTFARQQQQTSRNSFVSLPFKSLLTVKTCLVRQHCRQKRLRTQMERSNVHLLRLGA